MPVPGIYPRVLHDRQHAPTLAGRGPQITQPRRTESQPAAVVLVDTCTQMLEFSETSSGWPVAMQIGRLLARCSNSVGLVKVLRNEVSTIRPCTRSEVVPQSLCAHLADVESSTDGTDRGNPVSRKLI